MAQNATIVAASLSDEELKKSIEALVNTVDSGMDDVAQKFDEKIGNIQGKLNTLSTSFKQTATEIKDAFQLMGTSFNDFAKSMEKASKAATGAGNAGGGTSTGGGGTSTTTYDDDTIGALKAEIAELNKKLDLEKLNTKELQDQVDLINKQKNLLKEQTTTTASKRLDNAIKMPTTDLDEANKKLRMLEILQRRYKDTTELSVSEQNKLSRSIAQTKKAIDDITSKRPKSLKDVLGMDESSVDAVTKKMRALRGLQVNPKNTAEVKKLGDEYQRLQRLQATLLGKNIQLTHSNNYLAQSFGYIRNRIVYALTLGAITSFTKQIYEIRGQYELLERSLGILIDDMRRGSEIFQELNQMALKSPFTLMELATGAKQLLAYNFAEEEVVETTRRLADISAALGVPMERLVYNLGQIRAQTVLNARDARDFANAGLAIVPMLAQMYTEEKRFGDEIVTTAQVFSMMSDKMVSYADVMKVINKVTDEGGKFFDFQAKQADTLKVKMANLTLAWNNMLNEIGAENQSTLEAPLRGLKLLFENWRLVAGIMGEIITIYGAYKAVGLAVAVVNRIIVTYQTIKAFISLARSITSAKEALVLLNLACKTNVIGILASAIAAVVGYFIFFNDNLETATEYTEKFGKAGGKAVKETEELFDTLRGISKESSNYKKVMGELNSILDEYGLELVKETDGLDELNKKREVAIGLIKQEALERKHLNEIQQGRDTYSSNTEDARKKLLNDLQNAMTGEFWVSENEEIQKNAVAISNIIASVVEENITLIAGKTEKEYDEGLTKLFNKIQSRMRAIGISESTIAAQWRDDALFSHENLVQKYIDTVREAKEAQDTYNEAIDKNYEAEKKAAEESTTFNDKVDRTQTKLMKAANDTDHFVKKLEALMKEFGGQNIIDFLIKVKTQVPKWMTNMSLTELTRLAAKFTAIATEAQKAGLKTVNVNGKVMSVEDVYRRAAEYKQAAEDKAADIEARKSTTITKEASNALKEYKAALEAVKVAKNRLKQGTGDEALVKEKEAEEQKKYNEALKKGVSLKELEDAKNKGKSKKDILGDAFKKEVEIITNLQKLYKEYRKAGVGAQEAIAKATEEYAKTLASTNATLSKYGVKQTKSGAELADMDLRDLRAYYQSLLSMAQKANNTRGVEALEKAIANLNVEINKIDYKKITDGLNNELSKLKDEYELAVEFDANPELGGVFADMMGLSEDQIKDLPKDFEGVLKKLQSKIDSELGNTKQFNLSANLNKATFDQWLTKQGIDANSELAKSLKAYVDYANKVRKDETVKQVEEWNKLLEKYAEYEYKRKQILDEYNREMETARKKNADSNIIRGIENRRDSRLAELDFNEFMKTPEWITATGNLADMSKSAIGMLIDRINDYKKTAKNLTPKQIKELNKALKQLHAEQRKNNPFKAISTMLSEARERMENFDEEINNTKDAINNLEVAISKAKTEGKDTSEQETSLVKLRKRLDELIKHQKEAGKIDATAWVGAINETVGAIQGAVAVFDDLAKAIGGVNESDVDKTFSILTKAGNAAATGAQIGGAWGAVIGGVVGAATGIISLIAESGNENINSAIKSSELAVKRLELAYIDLQKAVDKAYGTSVIGAKTAAAAAKKLELQELERQLRLEQSRDSKHRDEDRIIELQKQIKELKYEIQDTYTEIVNDLMGTDVGSFAENLVSAMIDAFKQGEDAMKVFNDKFDELIDNMIMKSLTSRIVSSYIDKLWKEQEQKIKLRSQDESKKLADAQAEYDKVKNMTSDEWIRYHYGTSSMMGATAAAIKETGLEGAKLAEYLKNLYEHRLDALEVSVDNANKALNDATAWTDKDILDVVSGIENLKGGLYDNLYNAISQWYTFGEDSDKNLSALQQGIQGITEDTAGAIESYLNLMSQKMFEQNNVLVQIRDLIVGFDFDTQLGVQSQMLLQLQNSYQVQLSIKSTLDGWSNASGMAVKVEMV